MNRTIAFILLLICSAAIFAPASMAQDRTQDIQKAESAFDAESALKSFLSQIGISGSESLESYTTSFISKCADDIIAILEGAEPVLSTPEGLMSISSAIVGLLSKNPVAKTALVGLGAAGAYHSATSDGKDETATAADQLTTENTDSTKKVYEVTPTSTEVSTGESDISESFFNTIKK